MREAFDRYITDQYIVNEQGDVVDSGNGVAFGVDVASQIRKPAGERERRCLCVLSGLMM